MKVYDFNKHASEKRESVESKQHKKGRESISSLYANLRSDLRAAFSDDLYPQDIYEILVLAHSGVLTEIHLALKARDIEIDTELVKYKIHDWVKFMRENDTQSTLF